MIELCSKVHAANLVRWAKDRPDAHVLSADLTSSCEADAFRDAYPARFLSMGIAEQNMVSFAAGMAREGLLPLVHTFAVFICRRAYDQVAMSVAYSNLPVKLFGFLPGITTPGGASHQAIDDVALMRGLPNMTVLEVGDATEVESVLDVMAAVDGPVYVRMLRGEVPRLFAPSEPMQLGVPRVLGQGDDLLLVSSGICTEEALKAAQALRSRGVGVGHLHVSTLKPFNAESVLQLAAQCRFGVVTVENHLLHGGLGSAVAEAMAEAGLGQKLLRLGLHDTFSHGASRPCLLREAGIDAAAIVQAAERLTGKSLGMQRGELAAARSVAVHSAARAEAL